METTKMREDLEYIRATLAGGIAPFISSLLARPKIVATEAIKVAAVDTCGTIYLNPEAWEGLSFPDKAYVAAHEAVHLAFCHPGRRGTREPETWNVAADCVVWVILTGIIQAPIAAGAISPARVASACEVDARDVEKMAVEEVYDLLISKKRRIEGEGIGSDLRSSSLAGEVVQEGDPEAGDPENWKIWVRQAEALQRAAGTVPAGLERAIQDFLLPDIDPRALIRGAIRVGLGRVLVNDWKRRSKRHPDLPEIKRFTMPNIWALVDTSGSISEEDLQLELGTVYEFSRLTRIHVICFDAEAYEELTAKNPSEVVTVVAKKLKGGGGTEIQGALRKTKERMRYRDMVLILTDGHIFDLDDADTQALLKHVASQGSLTAFLTLDHMPAIPGWRAIKIRRRG